MLGVGNSTTLVWTISIFHGPNNLDHDTGRPISDLENHGPLFPPRVIVWLELGRKAHQFSSAYKASRPPAEVAGQWACMWSDGALKTENMLYTIPARQSQSRSQDHCWQKRQCSRMQAKVSFVHAQPSPKVPQSCRCRTFCFDS